MTLRVRVESPAGSPAEYPLDGDEMVIGRAATAGIIVADARVSRQHARLVRRDDAWWIEDLGARNRTLLNGAPLHQPAPVRPGDRLQIGEAILRLVEDAAPRAVTKIAPAADSARMWTVNEIHRALAATLSLSELLDLILARCFDVLEPEEGLIMLRGRDGTLTPAASRRHGGDPGAPVTVPRRLVEEVVGKGQPALVLAAAYDDRFSGSESMVMSGIRSVVAAPIIDADGPLGLITLCSRVGVRRFTSADLDMLVTIASAAALRVRNVALADALAERRVVEHELEVAHDVQMAMLPRSMPAYPGLGVAAALKPARSVGGDLYDVLLDGHHLWFIVADVAGKSIAAALYMAIARALFRATARGGVSLEDVAARMNEELARDNDRLMFVTAALGCLDLATSTVALVDAGHTPAVLSDASGVRDVEGVPKGPALGVVPSAAYTAARFHLSPSAALVLYTDGLTDARSASEEMFGEQRLTDVIAAAGGAAADVLVRDAMQAVERFAGDAPADDDLTVLALRYSPA